MALHSWQDTQTVTTVVLADFTAIQTVPMTNRTLVHVYNDGRREAHPLLLKVSPITIGNHHAAQLCIEARLPQKCLASDSVTHHFTTRSRFFSSRHAEHQAMKNFKLARLIMAASVTKRGGTC